LNGILPKTQIGHISADEQVHRAHRTGNIEILNIENNIKNKGLHHCII